jgi:hypothetical protein
VAGNDVRLLDRRLLEDMWGIGSFRHGFDSPGERRIAKVTDMVGWNRRDAMSDVATPDRNVARFNAFSRRSHKHACMPQGDKAKWPKTQT